MLSSYNRTLIDAIENEAHVRLLLEDALAVFLQIPVEMCRQHEGEWRETNYNWRLAIPPFDIREQYTRSMASPTWEGILSLFGAVLLEWRKV